MKVYLLECGVENMEYTVIYASYEEAYAWAKEVVFKGVTRAYNSSRIAQKEYGDNMAKFIEEHINYHFRITAYDPYKNGNVIDCEKVIFDDKFYHIEWEFDAFGNLKDRLYAGFSFMPNDEAEDAGTKFKVGDFVLVPKYNRNALRFEDGLYVIMHAPPKKSEKPYWTNYYTLYDECGVGGHIHPHETEIKPFEDEVPPDSPLWFWRDYARGLVSKEAEINICGKKLSVESAIYDGEIFFHEGISWREFLKNKTGG